MSKPRLTVLPEAMRSWRRERSISQEALAAAVEVTPGMIALIETKRRQPSYELLERIAKVLGISPHALALIEAPAEEDAA